LLVSVCRSLHLPNICFVDNDIHSLCFRFVRHKDWKNIRTKYSSQHYSRS
jgi:hypothetical protein